MALRAVREVKKKRSSPESDEQIKFSAWLNKNGYKHNHSPNGGNRLLKEGVKFKRMGTSKGFPDIEVPFPSGPYHGLYFEFKSCLKSKLSMEQIEWLRYLRQKGYWADVVYSFEEAKEIFLRYVSFTPQAA